MFTFYIIIDSKDSLSSLCDASYAHSAWQLGCVSIRTLRAVLRWIPYLVSCSWRTGGLADENKVRWTRIFGRRGSGGIEPVTVLHPQLFLHLLWTVSRPSRRLWKHFCLHLISDCAFYTFSLLHAQYLQYWFAVCTAPLNRWSSCYGALEIVVTLLLPAIRS